MIFKIKFPTGHNVVDINDDNLDIHVILPNNRVYFGTLFTQSNIRKLMKEEGSDYFWAVDMLIVADLSQNTIYKVIDQLIKSDVLTSIFSEIGFATDIYQNYHNFEEIPEYK